MYKYVFIDYSATGEGRTIIGLVTHGDGWNNEDGSIASKDEGALKTMKQRVGDYLAIGSELLERDEFIERMGKCLPEAVIQMTDENYNTPCNFYWFGEFHFNYS